MNMQYANASPHRPSSRTCNIRAIQLRLKIMHFFTYILGLNFSGKLSAYRFSCPLLNNSSGPLLFSDSARCRSTVPAVLSASRRDIVGSFVLEASPQSTLPYTMAQILWTGAIVHVPFRYTIHLVGRRRNQCLPLLSNVFYFIYHLYCIWYHLIIKTWPRFQCSPVPRNYAGLEVTHHHSSNS